MENKNAKKSGACLPDQALIEAARKLGEKILYPVMLERDFTVGMDESRTGRTQFKTFPRGTAAVRLKRRKAHDVNPKLALILLPGKSRAVNMPPDFFRKIP